MTIFCSDGQDCRIPQIPVSANKQYLLLAMGWILVLVFGCNPRVQGPELESSPADVELIRQRIDATDW